MSCQCSWRFQHRLQLTNRPRASVEHIAHSTLILRGQRVLLDSDLASLYQAQTKWLNEQVKRNIDGFPEDFMFRLTRAEVAVLHRSQNATGSQKHRNPRSPGERQGVYNMK